MADLYEKNEDGTYIGLDLTNFPAEVDSWQDTEDVDPASIDAANQYREAMLANNVELAQQVLEQNPNLNNKRIDAVLINSLKHAVMAIERLFKEDIQEYIIDKAQEVMQVDASLTVRGSPADAAATGQRIEEVRTLATSGTSHNHDSTYLRLTGGTISGSLTVTGNLSTNGTITGNRVVGAVYNDYAEFFPRAEKTEPGDIIALDVDSIDEKYKKATEYDLVVVGVHSDEYGSLIGGDKFDNAEDYIKNNMNKYIPVGLSGRVMTKVIGKIKKGDIIIPSSIPGVGIAAYEKNPPHGQIVGYAVEEDDLECIRKLKVKLR